MALTREERGTIEEMLNRIRKLERQVADQQIDINALLDNFNALESEGNILDWTQQQWDDWLRPFIRKYQSQTSFVPRHNHESDQQGGPCFAQKGATLISENPEEE